VDVQGAFLAKVILHQDLRAAVNARIGEQHFTDDRYQRVYGYLLQHWKDYGVSPDLTVVQRAFPSMQWDDHTQPLEYFTNALLQRRKGALLVEGLNEAAKFVHATDDPDAIDQMEAILKATIIAAAVEANRTYDIDFTSEEYFYEVQTLLDEREADPGYLRGISTGFSGIDYVTGGLQPEHFIVLMGIPKSFKSATALAMAIRIHQQAKRPLFVGFEMSNTEQTDRSLSIISGVSLTKIMNGTMKPNERKRVDAAHKGMLGMRSLLFSSDIASALTVSGIQAKIQELEPDVTIIDGAYMMSPEDPRFEPGSAQAITSISRGLKRLAQSSKIPIVVTTQASQTRSKGGLHMGSAMYSQSWAQDADILLGVERVQPTTPGGSDEENENVTTAGPVQVKLRVIESRSGPRKNVILEWDWSVGSVEELDPMAMTQKLRQRPGTLNEDDDDDDY
jgi:replicative DNA helicase